MGVGTTTLSFQQIQQAWSNAGGPTGLSPLMAAIAESESSGENVMQQGQPYATTGWGLWQITPGNSEPQAGTDAQLLDPNANAKAAVAKYNSQGLGAWRGDRAYNIWQQHGAPSSPTVNQLSSWGIDTQGVSSSPAISPVGPGLVPGRTDQGLDYSGSGPIYATGAGTIESITNSGWPGGAFITLLLNSPVDATHKMVYYAEDIQPGVSINQQVTAGQVLGQATGGSSGIEIGWADPNAIGQSLNTALHGPYSGSGATPEGTNFASYVSGGSYAGASSGTGGTSGAPGAVALTGMAGFLQQISDLLNPDVKNNTPVIGGAVGTTQTLVEKVVFRGMFTIMFMGVAYVGIKMLTKGSSAPSVVSTVIPELRMAKSANVAREAEAGKTARATMKDTQQTAERANPTVKKSRREYAKTNESHIYYHKNAPIPTPEDVPTPDKEGAYA